MAISLKNKRTDDNNSHLCEILFGSDNDQRWRNLENNTNRIDTNDMIEQNSYSKYTSMIMREELHA